MWDLVNAKTPYLKVLPVLLQHLDRPYPEKVFGGIARSLAVPDARPYWNQLVDHYLASTESVPNEVKWALHAAIAEAADMPRVGANWGSSFRCDVAAAAAGFRRVCSFGPAARIILRK